MKLTNETNGLVGYVDISRNSEKIRAKAKRNSILSLIAATSFIAYFMFYKPHFDLKLEHLMWLFIGIFLMRSINFFMKLLELHFYQIT